MSTGIVDRGEHGYLTRFVFSCPVCEIYFTCRPAGSIRTRGVSGKKLRAFLWNQGQLVVTQTKGIRRIGMVIGIKEECIAAYRALHDGPGVRDLLEAANMRNFNIFLQKMPDGRYYEFAYFEYHGTNYEADKAKLAKEPRNIAWLKQTDATQVPLEGHSSWAVMEEIFFNA